MAIFGLFSDKDKLKRRLKKLTGFHPGDLSLYKQAFTHKSAADTRGLKSEFSNERLEFLGDAVLSLVIGEFLYARFPGTDEGFLSKMRAKVVNREFFNRLGYELGLDKLLEENSSAGGAYEIVPSMVGNCFEALFGAIFLDKGYKHANVFFKKVILPNHLDIDQIQYIDTNYKSQLLEWCQKFGKAIDFRHVSTEREGQQLVFYVQALVDGEPRGEGKGLQKKKAEQDAAKNALERLNIL